MIDVISATEPAGDFQVRAWTGIATDEGVGLLSIVEISDARGTQVCRFEEFLPASAQQTGARWSRSDKEAAIRLQEQALGRARAAVQAGTLSELHGGRFDTR